MTLHHTRFVLISLTSAALCGVLASGPAGAAGSPCKGLAQAECATTAGCGWTNEYTRKDGKTVAGYCKKASKPGAAAAKEKTPAPLPAAPATGTGQMPSGMGMGTGTAAGKPPVGTATGKPPVGTGTGAGQMPMPK